MTNEISKTTNKPETQPKCASLSSTFPKVERTRTFVQLKKTEGTPLMDSGVNC